MKESLLSKYYPKTFSDYIGDENFINSIKFLIDNDDFNILIFGDNCSGKTCLINCIVNYYYKTNLNNVNNSENILIINQLKEQGISYYRNELKNFCESIVNNKKKLLILDDIDYINDQSQYIFNFYIEKYSKNINVIASVKNIQKVTNSLLSRLLIIKLNNINHDLIEKVLDKICTNENISLNSNHKNILLNNCNNSIKKIINNLEFINLINIKKTDDLIEYLSNNISIEKLKQYTEICKNNNLHLCIEFIYNIYDDGYSVIDILDSYFLFVKNTDIIEKNKKYEIIKLISKYTHKFYSVHEDVIELAFFTNNLNKLLLN